jgi:hypothetical protein
MISDDTRKTASEFNARNKWDCNEAFDLAVQVLTDANWHSLAQKLKDAAQAEMEAEVDPMDDYNYVGSKDHY